MSKKVLDISSGSESDSSSSESEDDDEMPILRPTRRPPLGLVYLFIFDSESGSHWVRMWNGNKAKYGQQIRQAFRLVRVEEDYDVLFDWIMGESDAFNDPKLSRELNGIPKGEENRGIVEDGFDGNDTMEGPFDVVKYVKLAS
jgi:hypothetical protein